MLDQLSPWLTGLATRIEVSLGSAEWLAGLWLLSIVGVAVAVLLSRASTRLDPARQGFAATAAAWILVPVLGLSLVSWYLPEPTPDPSADAAPSLSATRNE